MELALVQLNRGLRLEENAERAARLIREAQGADLVLLPENWLGPFPVGLGEYVSALQEVTRSLSPATLVAGGAQYVRIGDKVYSRGAFLRAGSKPLGYYEKRFPSRPVGEREYLAPGRKMAIFDHAGWRVGALVCVDLFYPELARRLALKGCQLIPPQEKWFQHRERSFPGRSAKVLCGPRRLVSWRSSSGRPVPSA